MVGISEDATVDMTAASGVVRVTITPPRPWLFMLFEAAGIATFSLFVYRSWAKLGAIFRYLLAWGAASAVVGWFYQLSGSEIIEFDAQGIRIVREILGWPRTSAYSIEQISELEWNERSGEDSYGLKCKVGWRTVRFGRNLSEQQATEIFTKLQESLPEVAHKLGATAETAKKHFTTLGLS